MAKKPDPDEPRYISEIFHTQLNGEDYSLAVAVDAGGFVFYRFGINDRAGNKRLVIMPRAALCELLTKIAEDHWESLRTMSEVVHKAIELRDTPKKK